MALVLLLATLANTGPVTDNDYGLHLRIGQEIAETGRPVLVDNHSYTLPGAHYPDHEWAIQWLFFQLQRLVGDGGMVALKGLLIGATLLLVALSVRGPLPLKLGLVLLVLLLGLNHSQVRPHLFSWLFAAALGLLLQRRLYWAIPPLLLLWGNSHGSVLLGVGIAGLYFLEEFWHVRRYPPLLWAAACALAPLANPSGIGIYTLFFEIKGQTGFVGEWQPYTPLTWPFWLLVLLIGLAVWKVVARRPFNLFDAVRVAVLGFLGFQASRNGVIDAILLAPFLGDWLNPSVSRWSPRAQEVAAGAMAAIVALTLGVQLYNRQALRFELDYEQLPVAAVRFAKSHGLTGPLFNDYNFGGYLLWQGWPDYPVFVDGRLEVYGGPVLDDYLLVSKAQQGWQQVVERYGITFFMLRPDRDITKALLQDPRWDLVYFDYNSAILVRHDLFPGVRRLTVVSPTGNRGSPKPEQVIAEINYLLQENPLFFGGYKILAFQRYKLGDYAGARKALEEYLRLHPQGRRVEDTKEIMQGLANKGEWR